VSDKPPELKESDMKKELDQDDMLEEYDFSKGVRGKYAKRYHESSNIVVLEPDVAARFPNSEAVNQALRTLAKIQDRKRA
jgi:hypothetical protein